ncbi:hypothetical protein [Yoonia tamlensis]|nr:hypothetical protein [Yoonia tamlensis]
MKTVVSFFHDLAGHDRFMDIEPQAPDMEELALLTAAQAGTDIEIAGEGHNVILRAADDEGDAEETAESDPVDDDADDHEEIEEVAASDEEDDDEIENVFDEVEAEADEEEIVLTGAASPDDDDDEAAFDDADFENITDVEDDDYVEDIDEDEPLAAEAEDAEIAPADDEEEESIAAKLQRIRAVVGRGHVQAPAMPVAEVEDEDHDDDMEDFDARDDDGDDAPVINPLAQRLADLAKRNQELAAADAAQEEARAAQEAAEDDDDEDEDDFTDADDGSDVETDADDAHDPLVLTAAPDDEFDDLEAIDADAFEEDEDDDDTFDLTEELKVVTREIEERDAQRAKAAELRDSPDAAFSRILSQTDAHLNEPEGRRHRDAFAQLKAAVAATEAARELGDESPAKSKDSAFREDLGAHDAEEGGQAMASSPLRLVPSESASDADAPTDAAAERLRQIASKVEENMAPTTGGFAEFAADHDAAELSDLIEAAAAYSAFVEGVADFSRPQVMRKVQSVTQEEISREDGLRSFGRLLRQNKIVKLNNGRFQVAENTRFRPSGS